MLLTRAWRSAKSHVRAWHARGAQRRVLDTPLTPSIDLTDFDASLRDPTAYYLRAFQAFHRELPAELRQHREYFRAQRRGYGEDAFHVMWWQLFQRFRPHNFLEVGIYRGQVLSLILLLAKLAQQRCEVCGISPFSPAGDSVSNYLNEVDYLDDTRRNIAHFGLPQAHLVKALSTDSQALEFIAGRRWDAVYIDGSHEYAIARADWENCSSALAPGGIIVLDDASQGTAYRPPAFATAGHPGPSRVAAEIDRSKFREILRVGHNRVFQSRET